MFLLVQGYPEDETLGSVFLYSWFPATEITFFWQILNKPFKTKFHNTEHQNTSLQSHPLWVTLHSDVLWMSCTRVVNCFWKWSLNDRCLFHFSIVFKERSFFWKRFATFIRLFLKTDHFWKKRSFEKNKILLTIMLTIVNMSFIKTVVFEKLSFLKYKLHATLLNVVLYEVKQLWGS